MAKSNEQSVISTRTQKALGIIEIGSRLRCGMVFHAVLSLAGLKDVGYAAYQRNRNQKHVNRIKDNYDKQAALPPRLSLRDGKLWCMDGGHTIAAMVALGIEECDVVIYTGLTYSDEAWLFFVWNDIRKSMAGWNKFYADMEGGNKAMSDILAIAHKHKLTTPKDDGVAKPQFADLTNAGILVSCNKKGGLDLVDKVCRVLSKCWKRGGRVMQSAKQADILRGLVGFLKGADEVQVQKTIATLKEMTPENIRAIAKNMPSKGRIDAAQLRMAFAQVVYHHKMAA